MSIIIPNSQISDWRDLQSQVAMFFLEMGYEAITPFTVDLAGRGQKEVDVYVTDPRASVNQVILVECKFWASAIPQDTVHSFHTVMTGAGANTGFIVSKAGFQSGAYEAAQSTNIHLLTWEELQHKFGRQWYIVHEEAKDRLLSDLRVVEGEYLDQFNPVVIHNTMFFEATNLLSKLYDVLNDLRIALFAAAFLTPASYDTSGPFEVSVYEGFPEASTNRWGQPTLLLGDVRQFFHWLDHYGRTKLDCLKALRDCAHHGFRKLPDEGMAAIAGSLKTFVEEMPIRTFREALGDETYNRLIKERLRHN